jgi:hypothetical protein
MAGQFQGVDLGRVAQAGFAPEVRGTADIAVRKLRFQQGRIEEVSGLIVGGPGLLGRGVPNMLTSNLHLTPVQQIALINGPINYDRLSLEFWVDSQGVSLAGHCEGVPGAIVAANGQPILLQPDSHAPPASVSVLIQTLAPKIASRFWLGR